MNPFCGNCPPPDPTKHKTGLPRRVVNLPDKHQRSRHDRRQLGSTIAPTFKTIRCRRSVIRADDSSPVIDPSPRKTAVLKTQLKWNDRPARINQNLARRGVTDADSQVVAIT